MLQSGHYFLIFFKNSKSAAYKGERLQIESGLWWHAYGSRIRLKYFYQWRSFEREGFCIYFCQHFGKGAGTPCPLLRRPYRTYTALSKQSLVPRAMFRMSSWCCLIAVLLQFFVKEKIVGVDSKCDLIIISLIKFWESLIKSLLPISIMKVQESLFFFQQLTSTSN